MKKYIIATDEGIIDTPYGGRTDNMQILGFSFGKSKENAIENFIEMMNEENLIEIEGWNTENFIAYQLDKSELN